MAKNRVAGQKINFMHRVSHVSLELMTDSNYTLRQINHSDISDILNFTDHWIGRGYFSRSELSHLLDLSHGSSFIASSNDAAQNLLGVRISIAAGEIEKLNLKNLSFSAWPFSSDEMAYFKSLFVAQSAQGQGIGKSLSSASLKVLKELGAKAVACHSWLESPEDSSRKYLKKMGFKEICRHEKYWYDVDYECTRCGKGKCLCTAIEMVKVFR